MHREQFLEATSRAACTVTIVTTDGRAGVTVSAIVLTWRKTQSLSPPAEAFVNHCRATFSHT